MTHFSALIEAMRTNLYVRRRAGQALRDRTGMGFEDIPSEWAEWYAGPPPAAPGLPPMPPLEEAIVPRRLEIVLPEDADSEQP